MTANRTIPRKQIGIFVLIDVILVLAVVAAVFQHVKIIYVMTAFILLSVANGIFLIVTVLRSTPARKE